MTHSPTTSCLAMPSWTRSQSKNHSDLSPISHSSRWCQFVKLSLLLRQIRLRWWSKMRITGTSLRSLTSSYLSDLLLLPSLTLWMSLLPLHWCKCDCACPPNNPFCYSWCSQWCFWQGSLRCSCLWCLLQLTNFLKVRFLSQFYLIFQKVIHH